MRLNWKEMSDIPFKTDKKREKIDVEEIEKFKRDKRKRSRKNNLLKIVKKCEEYFDTEITFDLNEETKMPEYQATLAVIEIAKKYEFSIEEIAEFLGISQKKTLYLRHELLLFQEKSASLRRHIKKIDL